MNGVSFMERYCIWWERNNSFNAFPQIFSQLTKWPAPVCELKLHACAHRKWIQRKHMKQHETFIAKLTKSLSLINTPEPKTHSDAHILMHAERAGYVLHVKMRSQISIDGIVWLTKQSVRWCYGLFSWRKESSLNSTVSFPLGVCSYTSSHVIWGQKITHDLNSFPDEKTKMLECLKQRLQMHS